MADANITMALGTDRSGDALAGEGPTSLPQDVGRQGVARVRTAALVFAITWAFVIVLNDFVFAGRAGAPGIVWGTPQTAMTIVGLGASLGIAWLSRRLNDNPERLFDIALVYGVVMALLIALLTETSPRMEPQAISWVCVIILTLPTIAPSSPRKIFVASIIAAATVPLALAYTRYVNPAYDPKTSVMVWLTIPPFICAVLAVVPATVIRGLGRQVKKARELGSYRLEERIGAGGMGEVYRARHRLLARPAAVKLISPTIFETGNTDARRVAVERFRREAQAAASLKSPHTIQLYDYGVGEDGVFYYVMELLDGIDLQELVTGHGPLPPERVAHLLIQACDSLGEAHSAGLIHRDIKPSNIYACRMGLRVDYVKVLDFGLVKSSPARAIEETHLTNAGLVSGTPAFMSPESASGLHSVGASSDVYALGCVAYWLLTGHNVFIAPNAMMVMMMHIQNSPVPPSLRASRTIPKKLEEVVMLCLSKKPGDRPADAAQLRDLLMGSGLSAKWTENHAETWWGAHRPVDGAIRPVEQRPDLAIAARS